MFTDDTELVSLLDLHMENQEIVPSQMTLYYVRTFKLISDNLLNLLDMWGRIRKPERGPIFLKTYPRNNIDLRYIGEVMWEDSHCLAT